MACRVELILTYSIKHSALPKLEKIRYPLFMKWLGRVGCLYRQYAV